ncbi:MAG: SWIM zinc finger family protein [Deltaproteobacteria bacterium]|nr:SWIM zinc finger family protein [Deltaproteobacteria bacterium]
MPDLNDKKLDNWAGETIIEQGRKYQRARKVKELVYLKDGRLGAVVIGTRTYLVAVSFSGGEIKSDCTCPFESDCKHAVAAVLEYRQRLEAGQTIEVSADKKYGVLSWHGDPGDNQQAVAAETAAKLEAWFSGQSLAQLMALLLGICREHADIAAEFIDMINLQNGNTPKLLQKIKMQARQLIESAPDWDDCYDTPPDYSALLKTMKQALPFGLADELLDVIGRVLGGLQEQVEIYDHNGEFACDVEPCYSTAVEILRASSLDSAEKMLWAVDQIIADQFELSAPLEEYLNEKHPADSWSEVADDLLKRLEKSKPTASDRSWGRDQLSNFAIHALEESGRRDEIIPLCEQEAPLTKSYVRLVGRLMEAGRTDDAERYITTGIAATYKDLAGIASSLRKLRIQILSSRKDWAGVITHHVCEFVEDPSTSDYGEVKKAAAKMKLWPQIRTLLLEYLQSGALPWQHKGWNLPAPDKAELLRSDRWRKKFPEVETLVEIAILEKDPAEVVKWHDLFPKKERYGFNDLELEIAEAVKKYDPERSLAIWKRLAEAEIAQTRPAAYQIAGKYLKKAGQLMVDLKREPEWRDYVFKLRAANARKKRLMEVLDTVSVNSLLDTTRVQNRI